MADPFAEMQRALGGSPPKPQEASTADASNQPKKLKRERSGSEAPKASTSR